MIFLPRIARAIGHPGIAGLLGLILIGIGIYGLISGDIRNLWAILIIIVGTLNLMRLLSGGQGQGDPPPS